MSGGNAGAFDPKVQTQLDCTVVPAPGWEWCGYCNGEGTVWVMDSSPDLNETVHECGRCDEGLVRTTSASFSPHNGSPASSSGVPQEPR